MPTDTTAPPQGLRDRKRAETQARIEAAALELVLRDGLEAATVDAISDRAGISPRTFFNYFESKDSAILGLQPRELDDEELDERIAEACTDEDAAADPIAQTVRLLGVAMGASGPTSPELHRDRMEVIRRHPAVLTNQFGQLQARKTRLIEHAGRILARHPDFADGQTATTLAPIVLSLCAGAVRAAFDEWAATAQQTTESDRDATERRAVELVRDTLRRLA